MAKKQLYLFRRKWVFFIPIHLVGWLFLLGVIGTGVYVFIDLYLRIRSIPETLGNFAIFFIILFLGYSFFGFYTCKPEKETFE